MKIWKIAFHSPELDQLEKDLENQYPGLTLSVYENEYKVYIQEIRLPENMQNQGIGHILVKAIQDYAKKVNKPILIDFTGVTCVNCRRMEELVWAKPEILNILKEEVVLISLYVDDRKELPTNEIYTNKSGKEINTYGKKWSDLAINKYEANIQPYYILMAHDETNLNKPVGYTPDVEEYKKWLTEGISSFKK